MTHSTENPPASLDYDPDTETYCTSFGPDTHSPSNAIISAVASITGDTKQSLPPLHDTISATALDTLFQPARDGGTPPDAQLTFTYYNYSITVNATGRITLSPCEQPE